MGMNLFLPAHQTGWNGLEETKVLKMSLSVRLYVAICSCHSCIKSLIVQKETKLLYAKNLCFLQYCSRYSLSLNRALEHSTISLQRWPAI